MPDNRNNTYSPVRHGILEDEANRSKVWMQLKINIVLAYMQNLEKYDLDFLSIFWYLSRHMSLRTSYYTRKVVADVVTTLIGG